MRDTEYMKKHLSIETEAQHGNEMIEHISTEPVEDPFHTTNVYLGLSWWTAFLMLFFPSLRNIRVRVKVRADKVAQDRWFLGVDTREKSTRECAEELHPDIVTDRGGITGS